MVVGPKADFFQSSRPDQTMSAVRNSVLLTSVSDRGLGLAAPAISFANVVSVLGALL